MGAGNWNKIDTKATCKGAYCNVHDEPLPSNIITPCTSPAILLGTSENIQGPVHSKTVVKHRSFTELPMSDNVIQQVNKFGGNDNITTDLEFLGYDGWLVGETVILDEDKDATPAHLDTPAKMPGIILDGQAPFLMVPASDGNFLDQFDESAHAENKGILDQLDIPVDPGVVVMDDKFDEDTDNDDDLASHADHRRVSNNASNHNKRASTNEAIKQEHRGEKNNPPVDNLLATRSGRTCHTPAWMEDYHNFANIIIGEVMKPNQEEAETFQMKV